MTNTVEMSVLFKVAEKDTIMQLTKTFKKDPFLFLFTNIFLLRHKDYTIKFVKRTSMITKTKNSNSEAYRTIVRKY